MDNQERGPKKKTVKVEGHCEERQEANPFFLRSGDVAALGKKEGGRSTREL